MALDKGDGQTQSLDGAYTAKPSAEEQLAQQSVAQALPVAQEAPDKEEVVVEPNLPVTEPAPSPAGPVSEPEEVEPEPLSPEEEYRALVEAMPADEPRYVAGNRGPKLKVGRYFLKPGMVVPGAHRWPRLETWVRSGQVVKE